MDIETLAVENKNYRKSAKRTKRHRKALSDRKFNNFFALKINGRFAYGSLYCFIFHKDTTNVIFDDESELEHIPYGDMVYPLSEDIPYLINNETVKEACSKFQWDVSTTMSIIPAFVFRNRMRIDFHLGTFVRFFPPKNIPHVSEFLRLLGAVENMGDSFFNGISILRFYGFLNGKGNCLKGTLLNDILPEYDTHNIILDNFIMTKDQGNIVKEQVKKIVERHCGENSFKEDAYNNALKYNAVPGAEIIKIPEGNLGEKKSYFNNFKTFLESMGINISYGNSELLYNSLCRCLSRKCCVSQEDSLIYVPPMFFKGHLGIDKDIIFDLSNYDIYDNINIINKSYRYSPPNWVRKEMFEYDPFPIDKERGTEEASLYKWSYLDDQKWGGEMCEKKILEDHFAAKKISYREMKDTKSVKVHHAHLLDANELIKRGLSENNPEYMVFCSAEFHSKLDRYKTLNDKLCFLMREGKITKKKAKRLAKRAIERLEEENNEEANKFAQRNRKECKDILK